MMNCIEHGVLKDLPGYKAILKAVLKSQIQNLVEQLSKEAEEETVLLSVSTADGTLSHLGSLHGKDFLQNKDDIKFQFLTHCLKKKHTAAFVNLPAEGSIPKDNHSSIREDLNRQNGNSVGGQSKQTLNQLWQHSNDIPITSKDNNNINPLENTFQKNQDEFHDANAEFTETLTVNGEKLVVQTNPARRKRKRKPSYIPNTQRIKADETDVNVKVENVESFDDVVEPSALNESDPVSSQGDDIDVSIKAEPADETLEDTVTLSTNDSLLDNVNDVGFQHDIPLMRASQHDLPLLRPENTPLSPGDKTPKQESADGKFYFNFGTEVGKVPLNPAEMYKTRFRKLLNIKLEDGERPYKCPLCARCFKLRHHLQNHYSVHSGERMYDCDICGKSFMRRGTMQIHRRIHNRETPYQCMKCFESFMRKDRLLYHKCPGRVTSLQDDVHDFPKDYSQSSSDISLDYSKSLLDIPDLSADYSKLSSDVQKIIAGYTDSASEVQEIPADLSKSSPEVIETPTDCSQSVSEEPTYVL